MKDDPSRIPPPPLVWELLDRLGEIIAERPPQPLAGAIDFGGGNGPLGEIIAERIAGIPSDYRLAVAQLTILEILITRTDVPLTGLVRRHVALKLAEEWLPPWALKEIYRQRELTIVESTLELAKLARKTKAWAPGKPKPKKTPLEIVVADRGFQSVDALKQFLKRERPARKKPRP
jgi:hypothetical protein